MLASPFVFDAFVYNALICVTCQCSEKGKSQSSSAQQREGSTPLEYTCVDTPADGAVA